MSDQYSDPSEIRHHIGATGAFSLTNVSGDVRVRGAETEDAVVLARSSSGRQEWLPLVVRKAQGMLSIELDHKGTALFGWLMRNTNVEFDITLPRGARVEVTAVSAEIRANGLVGEQTYKTVSGDVLLDGVGGRISATSVSGDVRLTGVQLVEPRANTTSGDLEIAAPNLRALQLRTVSGDAQVRGAFDTGALHSIESVSGNASIEAMSGRTVEVKKGIDFSGGGNRERVVGDGAARLRFRTLSGDLELSGERARRDAAPAPVRPAQPLPPVLPATPAAAAGPPLQPSSLEILRALERGEIDVEEASRRLEGAGSRG